MPWWAWLLVGLALWVVLSFVVGLALGRAIGLGEPPNH